MHWRAKWIWKKQVNPSPYNQTIVAEQSFKVGKLKRGVIAITADSFYRLFINGEWVNDGPCRSWPGHYQYDEIDVTSYLRQGTNEIRVVARYFGVGTFHQVPQRAGLLVQLELTPSKGKPQYVVSNKTWHVAEAKGWLPNTPKISIQMEPTECYDARLASRVRFSPATELCDAEAGPWKDLNPRDCRLLTREPFAIRRSVGANVVKSDWQAYWFPVARLLHPGLVEANHHVSTASAVATVVVSRKARRIRIQPYGYRVTINGRAGKDGVFSLKAGRNLLFAVVTDFFGHTNKEAGIRFVDVDGVRLENPLKRGHENPWCFVPLEEGAFVGDDLQFMNHPSADREALKASIRQALDTLLRKVKDTASLKALVGAKARCVPSKVMLLEEPHCQFMEREMVEDGAPLVGNPGALAYDNGEMTIVNPSPKGDVELVYDLGEQNCGYYDFELLADAGVQVDVFGLEYLTKSGRLQHTVNNRNGMRYVCADGVNRFTSLKRRSQRYLYVTLRNQKKPVHIRNLRLIESTYPVEYIGRFASSDPVLDRVWEISTRTLKLCMEDTFTDCPLYEQTLWVGDARNEALFAFTAFGAEELAKRCITLTGQSLERYPIAGCQVPSAWDCLLPAWSFLWGISVWDHYFYTGDKAFLKTAWKWVKQNLEGAERLLDERGLFSGPFWNMFDWTPIDDGHRTVVHNSMFFVGAIDAALKCADALGDDGVREWLSPLRYRLVQAVNALWDDRRKAYPDSIHNDGAVSTSVCKHTSFLSVLYDIVKPENARYALRNMINPPDGMVRVGSPFAIMYLYEALEKAGFPDAVVRSLYDCYVPMIDDGATTVWESFSTGTTGHDEFPTRSHCHAWSSAPIHFLNRIVLGIRQSEVGGAAFEISPWVSDLTSAEGTSVSVRGPVSAAWRRSPSTLDITAEGPAGVELRYARNDSHKGLRVSFNGESV